MINIFLIVLLSVTLGFNLGFMVAHKWTIQFRDMAREAIEGWDKSNKFLQEIVDKVEKTQNK